MIKTTTNRIAVPSVPLLIYSQLRAYLSHPLILFIRAVLSIRGLTGQISDNYPRDLKKICALMISLYRLLTEEMGNTKALSLIKAVTLPSALAVQMANFRYVETDRTLGNLVKYQKRTNREGLTRLNAMSVLEENENAYIFQIREKCCFSEIFSRFEVPELTTLFCEADNAIFNIYCPDELVFDRNGKGNRIADGADSCLFRIRRV